MKVEGINLWTVSYKASYWYYMTRVVVKTKDKIQEMIRQP